MLKLSSEERLGFVQREEDVFSLFSFSLFAPSPKKWPLANKTAGEEPSGDEPAYPILFLAKSDGQPRAAHGVEGHLAFQFMG
jgi:PAB1-binding protein PBP1